MMWARVIEFMLGCWLVISPFIFRHDPEARALWVNDMGCGAVAMLFALLAFKPALGKVHLLNGLVGLWLVGHAFLAQDPPPPAAYQNAAVIGLLLLMFCIIPSRSDQPPRAWREYYQKKE